MITIINTDIYMNDQTEKKSEWIAALQSDGSRMTSSRSSVIEILASSQCAMDPIRIYDEARQIHPRLGLMSVYRTLEKLEDVGLIQRVHQPGKCNMYFASPHGHQHLLLCNGCGKVEFFEGDDLDPLLANIGKGKHYDIHDHWLQLFGLCDQCLKMEHVNA
jgi:Fur family transcriptional regulator, ferric uptake regulator